MENDRKSKVSLFVGCIGMGLVFLSIVASGVAPSPGKGLESALSPPGCDSLAEQARAGGDRRSQEALVAALCGPARIHAFSCGIPASSDEIYEVRESRCVSRTAGIQSHSYSRARKVAARMQADLDYYRPGDTSGSTITGGEGESAK